MLIISKFHDYYDTVMRQGIDKTIVYNRELREIPTGFHRSPQYLDAKGGTWSCETFVVGFAGHLYPGIHLYRGGEERFLYSVKSFELFMSEFKLSDAKSHWWRHSNRNMLIQAARQKHFDKHTHVLLLPLFIEHKAPLFVVREDMQFINVNLKDWNFHKHVDPYSAFQSIASFISGVIGVGPRPMVELSDKDRAAKAGHDGRFSFRKPPGGGRWR